MEIKELKTIHDLVKDILEEHPQARDSDNILYYYVCKYIGTKHGFDIDKMSLPNFLLNMKNYRLPSIESVGRARRKVVEQHSELKGTDVIQKYRNKNEVIYREYSKECRV
jgi:hypothetical protein|nr:MAG TPA: hypothetical protein [Bacteriophage sp.]